MRTLSLSLLGLVLILASCRDDDSSNNPDSTPNPPNVSQANPQLSGQTVNASFFGRVLNQNLDPVSNAIVRIGSNSTTTDIYGFYDFNGISVDRDFAFIEVTAPGFFKQYRNLRPKTTAVNEEIIRLIPLSFSGTFETSTGGEFDIPGGGKVIFNPGDLPLPDGSSYTGAVSIATTYLNPTDPLLNMYLPGSLLAVRSSDELSLLTTFGMLGVELFSNSGQSLQLADGQTATLEFPIQDEQMDRAPETIELWYFDEQTGIWREDGTANKMGATYVAEVRHFTFWNCDIPGDWAFISGELNCTQIENSPFWAQVILTRPSGDQASAVIDFNGSFDGAVPANEILSASVVIYCDDVSIEYDLGEIGPFQPEDVIDLGSFDCPDGEIDAVQLSGTVVDCDGGPISGLIAEFEFANGGSGYVISDENGYFEFSLTCLSIGELYEVSILDLENLVEAASGSFVYDGSAIGFDLGTLVYCGGEDLENLMTFSDGQFSFSFTDLENQFSVGTCLGIGGFEAGLYDGMRKIGLYIDNPAGPGEYQECFFQELIEIVEYTFNNGNYYTASASAVNYNIVGIDLTPDEPNPWSVSYIEGGYSATVDVIIYSDSSETSIIDSYTTEVSGTFLMQN
jgi:hypothetical protein